MLQKDSCFTMLGPMKDDHVTAGKASTRETACTSTAHAHEHRRHRHAHAGGCCDNYGHVPSDRASWLGSVLPIVACAVCPTCLGLWAPVLSAVGVGIAITETRHHVLLGVAIVVTLGVAVVRFVRTQHASSFALTILGCALLGASHLFAEENHLLPWPAIAMILGSTLWQRRLEHRAMSRAFAAKRASLFSTGADEAT